MRAPARSGRRSWAGVGGAGPPGEDHLTLHLRLLGAPEGPALVRADHELGRDGRLVLQAAGRQGHVPVPTTSGVCVLTVYHKGLPSFSEVPKTN